MTKLINCEGLVTLESVRLSSNQAEKNPPERGLSLLNVLDRFFHGERDTGTLNNVFGPFFLGEACYPVVD